MREGESNSGHPEASHYAALELKKAKVEAEAEFMFLVQQLENCTLQCEGRLLRKWKAEVSQGREGISSSTSSVVLSRDAVVQAELINSGAKLNQTVRQVVQRTEQRRSTVRQAVKDGLKKRLESEAQLPRRQVEEIDNRFSHKADTLSLAAPPLPPPPPPPPVFSYSPDLAAQVEGAFSGHRLRQDEPEQENQGGQHPVRQQRVRAITSAEKKVEQESTEIQQQREEDAVVTVAESSTPDSVVYEPAPVPRLDEDQFQPEQVKQRKSPRSDKVAAERTRPAAEEVFEDLKARFAPLDAQIVEAQRDPSRKAQLDKVRMELNSALARVVPAIPVCRRVINDVCGILRGLDYDELLEYHGLRSLSRKFVAQGGDVGSNMVFGLATVGVHVGVAFPAFYDILRFTFCANCAFLIPSLPEGTPGRKPTEDLNDWCTKMGHIMRQYAALLQCGLRSDLIPEMSRPSLTAMPSHPLSLDKAWFWLASLLNLTPQALKSRKDVWATVLAQMLSKVGYALQQTYTAQFIKLMEAVEEQLLPLIKSQARIPDYAGDETDNPSLRVGCEMLSEFLRLCHQNALRPPEGSCLDETGEGQAGFAK